MITTHRSVAPQGLGGGRQYSVPPLRSDHGGTDPAHKSVCTTIPPLRSLTPRACSPPAPQSLHVHACGGGRAPCPPNPGLPGVFDAPGEGVLGVHRAGVLPPADPPPPPPISMREKGAGRPKSGSTARAAAAASD